MIILIEQKLLFTYIACKIYSTIKFKVSYCTCFIILFVKIKTRKKNKTIWWDRVSLLLHFYIIILSLFQSINIFVRKGTK